MFEKLENKLKKRIGLQAITKDTLRHGVITNFAIYPAENGQLPYYVKYMIIFNDGFAEYVDEKNVVILK